MRKHSLISLAVCCATFGAFAHASWTLDNDSSTLSFISTKNEHISEIHQFTKLSGQLSDSGQLKAAVHLSSVETNIPIRNERMQTYLFDVKSTPEAVITAQIPKSVMEMSPGTTEMVTLDSEITIKGKSAAYKVALSVSKDQDGNFHGTTVEPVLIKAASHDLDPGVAKLQELAGLKSIGLTVPMTFSVTFTQ
ncbi:YceI family protein [Aliiglaciecola sp. 3_MG-2023]|uniref:YceI family protein n=1 Tax=Aliiglaciecola sp. 3_MG-2023 TaxID=3062644 RepID=UPI0026E454DF|nr:YceI family protein [Aliiglaciecola sp. 3_MG-2023]MDO6694381.1 YceI family protein [Aliiglaciecola sp. 3_MG-2023]